MEPILCANCFEFFPPSPRHKDQTHCMEPECRRAKKAAWKRHKMDTDPKFKEDQKLINKKNGLKIILVIGKSTARTIQRKLKEIEHFKQSETGVELKNGKIKPTTKQK